MFITGYERSDFGKLLQQNLAGIRQRGFRAADSKLGTYLGTLALNGPLGGNFGFFVETYTTWQRESELVAVM